jgi:phosphate acetyltransferase
MLDNYLSHLTENALLITPGDRSDVILSALQAHQSKHYPKVAGMVLSGGFRPAPPIARLLEGLPNLVPILSVGTNTYDTATRVSGIRSYITADNRPKIDLSLELFEEFVDTQALQARISSLQPRGITPRCSSTTDPAAPKPTSGISCCRREPTSGFCAPPRSC